MDQNKVLLAAEEAAQRVFGGQRSAWSRLQDARKKRLPSLHIGNRVFFDLNSLNLYIEQQLQSSLTTEVTIVDGIHSAARIRKHRANSASLKALQCNAPVTISNKTVTTEQEQAIDKEQQQERPEPVDKCCCVVDSPKSVLQFKDPALKLQIPPATVASLIQSHGLDRFKKQLDNLQRTPNTIIGPGFVVLWKRITSSPHRCRRLLPILTVKNVMAQAKSNSS